MAPKSYVCPACEDLLLSGPSYIGKSPDYRHSSSHHTSLVKFCDAVNHQCYICTSLFNELCEDTRAIWSEEATKRSWSGTCYNFNETHEDFIAFELRCTDPVTSKWCYAHLHMILLSGSQRFERKEFRMVPCPALPPCDSIKGHPGFLRTGEILAIADLGTDTSSSQSLGLAHQWYMSCRGFHKQCNRWVKKPRWLPTRLIDIGCEGALTWKLHISDEKPLLSQIYVTLSYCWGSSQPFILTSANIQGFCQGKLISDLPKTFRDAIIVARRLSVRYIWIDSLCIIQDSIDDWRRESSMMKDVYANCACNISATDSLTPDGGLFRRRNETEIRPGVVRFNEKWYSISNQNYWVKATMETPLERRGWVFQERFLAPRVLHFTQKQIFWECFAELKCEGFHLHRSGSHFLKNAEQWMLLSSTDCSRDSLNKAQSDLWNTLVSVYSRCILTKRTDKLVAFSGIAHLFQDMIKDEYVAGLWRSHLRESLCWFVQHPTQPAEYVAPSWSWAAVDGSAQLPSSDPDATFILHITDVSITLSSLDPFGGVSGGFICVKGYLAHCVCTGHNGENVTMNRTGGGEGFTVEQHLDALPITNGQGTDLIDGTQTYCLAVKVRHYWRSHLYLEGLLLETRSGTSQEYTRIGQFKVTGRKHVEKFGIYVDEESGTVTPLESNQLSDIKIF